MHTAKHIMQHSSLSWESNEMPSFWLLPLAIAEPLIVACRQAIAEFEKS